MQIDFKKTPELLHPACHLCIKEHRLEKPYILNGKELYKVGDFSIDCNGIPISWEEILKSSLEAGEWESFPPEKRYEMIQVFDPSVWAKNNLELEKGGWEPRRATDENIEKYGLHKEAEYYQWLMLNCTARRRSFRIGRRVGKSEIIAVKVLHVLISHSNYKVLLICPYVSQIQLIFKRIEELCEHSPTFKSSIKRQISSPYPTIELWNGSQIIGFTSGSKSGGKADTLRGQGADLIVIDETERLATEDLASIMAILTTKASTELWASSTPTGRKELFYRMHLQPNYRNFHYPSMSNPEWNEAMENEMRINYTQMDYEHEICLDGDTEVRTTKGIKYLKNITTEDVLYDFNWNEIRVIRSSHVTREDSAILGIDTIFGTIKCTPDHCFPNRDFVKTPVSELAELPVYRPNNYLSNSREELLARLAGYNMGDGTINSTRDAMAWYSSQKKDMELLLKDFHLCFPGHENKIVSDITHNGPEKLVKVDGPRFTVNGSSKVALEFLDLGIPRGKKVEQEFDIPCFIKNGNLEIKRNFLAALFGAEGSTPSYEKCYRPKTISLSMLKNIGVNGNSFFLDLKNMLAEFGVESSVSVKRRNINGYYRDVYVLYIKPNIKNTIIFLEKIGYLYAEDKSRKAFAWLIYLREYEKTLEYRNRIADKVYESRKKGSSYKDLQQTFGLTLSQIDKIVNNNRYIKRLFKCFETFDVWSKKRVVGDCVQTKIFDKTKLPNQTVYNITVSSEDHSYLLASGIRTFNCANWGEDSTGVYQKQYIEIAKGHLLFKYSEQKPMAGWAYALGVDWNPVAGTQIIIVGGRQEGLEARFRVVDVGEVPIGGWSQVKALNEIVRLYEKWAPFSCYLDNGGGGSTAVEMLRRFALDCIGKDGPSSPKAGLLTAVKGIDFGSTIITFDPWTKEEVDRPLKPFMVGNSARRFEQGQIEISPFDEMLIRQLEGYIIDRITPTGIPVYRAFDEKVADHRLDALNLALLAFVMEKTQLGKLQGSNKITFIPLALQLSGRENKSELSDELRRLIQNAKLEASKQHISRTKALTEKQKYETHGIRVTVFNRGALYDGIQPSDRPKIINNRFSRTGRSRSTRTNF